MGTRRENLSSLTCTPVKPSARLRIGGRIVLVCAVAVAIVFYWMQSRSAAPELDELAAGYVKARDHQLGQLMGPLGVMMNQWMDVLQRPLSEAILIAAAGAVIAWVCFRLSETADEPEKW
jgi:Na+/H+ antiporter NhaD/arsenite permease-like protein